MTMKWKQNGYTLIEILVVLTIIGLLFNFGYVSFRDFSRRQAVAGAAKTIQGDLRLAQENATSGQKPSGCNTTLDSYGFNVQSSSRYTIEANCAATPPIVKDVTLASGIAISNPSPNPLQFKILGQGTNIGDTDWTLTLTQAGTGNTATVTVTSGGEIK
jgi:prepilin-type N-terminal cleavage/methylation domain-containing protein